ncbi:MAG: ArsC/Spx/MgsR family protein [Acidobacteriota bacterium]
MARITIYQKPTCTTCRQVYRLLQESGVDFATVDYYLEPIPKAKLKQLLRKMGLTAADLIRKKEPIYKQLKLAEHPRSEEELLDLMTKHPDLIQRPIVEKGAKAILARPADAIREFLRDA